MKTPKRHLKARVAVTGVGGGVGQAVLRALRLTSPDLWILGLDMNPRSAGLYLADAGARLAPCTDPDYVSELLSVLRRERIDVLIPGSDPELPVLARATKTFAEEGIRVLVGAPEPVDICRDKQRCADAFRQLGFPFVRTVAAVDALRLADEIGYPLVVKPTGGSASRGVSVAFCPDELMSVLDRPGYVVQEAAFPHTWTQPEGGISADSVYRGGLLRQEEEISIQVVYDHEGSHLGTFCSINRLQGGVPVFIDPQRLPEAEALAEEMTGTLRDRGLIGPCNVQCRLTANGLKVFEINPRFTGITGLRAVMGFNEVDAVLRRWLLDGPVNEVRASLTCPTGHLGLRYVDEMTVPRIHVTGMGS